MKKVKIELSFTKYTDSKFLNKASFIISCVTNNNKVFKTPSPAMADMEAAIATYADALMAAENMGKQAIKEKNTSREAVENLLYLLGLYIMYIGQNDASILMLSGYNLSLQPQPRHLHSLGNPILSQGISSGQILATVPRGNASSFSFDIADALPTEKTVWISFPCNNSTFTFTGLTAGKQYWIRVAAVGYRKQVVYTNIGTQTARL